MYVYIGMYLWVYLAAMMFKGKRAHSVYWITIKVVPKCLQVLLLCIIDTYLLLQRKGRKKTLKDNILNNKLPTLVLKTWGVKFDNKMVFFLIQPKEIFSRLLKMSESKF